MMAYGPISALSEPARFRGRWRWMNHRKGSRVRAARCSPCPAPRAAAEDDVVEHVDFQHLAGADDVARKPDIRLGRSGVAAWVVVREEHRRGVGADRGAKHIAGVGDQRVERAPRRVSTRISRRLASPAPRENVHLQQSIVLAQKRASFSGVSSTGDSWRNSSAMRLSKLNAALSVVALSRPTP